MLKDMLLALDEAWRCDASLPTGKAAAEIYAKLVDKMGQKDFSAVYNQIQSLSE
jgi:3-hydroxyisobutyrate dehydrogenase-like beta-hydroxyacid dehydrogenase